MKLFSIAFILLLLLSALVCTSMAQFRGGRGGGGMRRMGGRMGGMGGMRMGGMRGRMRGGRGMRGGGGGGMRGRGREKMSSKLSKEETAKMVEKLRKLEEETASFPSLFPGHFTGFVGGSQKVEFYVGDRDCVKFGLHHKTTGRHQDILSKLVAETPVSPVSTPYSIRSSHLGGGEAQVAGQCAKEEEENFGGGGGYRLKVTFFSEEILTKFLTELEKVQFIRKTGYGFLGLRTKWVPY
ncbi:hypothetical protein TYRP_018674 [Tyrophagus putrescentiae]|nr:hypothetical protein TYRP_018674 [Tyrophagus putrescentiae]